MAPTAPPLELTFDVDELDLGEIEVIENICGSSIFSLGERWASLGDAPALHQFSGRELLAMLYVAMRRQTPDEPSEATLARARAVRLVDLLPRA